MIGAQLKIPFGGALRIDGNGSRRRARPCGSESFNGPEIRESRSIPPLDPRFGKLQRLVQSGRLKFAFRQFHVAVPARVRQFAAPFATQSGGDRSGQFPPVIQRPPKSLGHLQGVFYAIDVAFHGHAARVLVEIVDKTDIHCPASLDRSAFSRDRSCGRTELDFSRTHVRNAHRIDFQHSVPAPSFHRPNAQSRWELSDTYFASFAGKRRIGQLQGPAAQSDRSCKILFDGNGIVDIRLKSAKPGERIGGLHACGIDAYLPRWIATDGSPHRAADI